MNASTYASRWKLLSVPPMIPVVRPAFAMPGPATELVERCTSGKHDCEDRHRETDDAEQPAEHDGQDAKDHRGHRVTVGLD